MRRSIRGNYQTISRSNKRESCSREPRKRSLRSKSRHQTGVCANPNTVHPISNNRHVFRRETVQPCKTQGQDQDQEGVDNRTVFADDTALIAHNQAQM